MPQHWQACSFILSLISLGVGITSRTGLLEEEAKAVLIELVEAGIRLSPEVYTSVLDRIDEM